MPNLEDYVITFVLASVFIVAMFAWAGDIAENYNFDRGVMTDDEKFNITLVKETVVPVGDDTENWTQSYIKDDIFTGEGTLVQLSVWGVMKNWIIMIQGIVNVLMEGISKVLGIPMWVISVIVGLLLLMLVSTGWKKVKSGE